MPIATEDSRWSNTGSDANAFEARITQGEGISAESSRGGETNTANDLEARITQAV